MALETEKATGFYKYEGRLHFNGQAVLVLMPDRETSSPSLPPTTRHKTHWKSIVLLQWVGKSTRFLVLRKDEHSLLKELNKQVVAIRRNNYGMTGFLKLKKSLNVVSLAAPVMSRRISPSGEETVTSMTLYI